MWEHLLGGIAFGQFGDCVKVACFPTDKLRLPYLCYERGKSKAVGLKMEDTGQKKKNDKA